MIQLQRDGLIESTVGNDVIMVVGTVENNQAKNLAKSSNRFAILIQDTEQYAWAAAVNVAGFAFTIKMLDAAIDGLPVALGFILLQVILTFTRKRPCHPTEGHCDEYSPSQHLRVLAWCSKWQKELMNYAATNRPDAPVMIFAILYGLKRDYEVLKLSRIHEEWERTGDNNKAARRPTESGRIITSAALVMITVFSIGISSISLMKQFGLMLFRCRSRYDHCACTLVHAIYG